jgi:hypothetical protein
MFVGKSEGKRPLGKPGRKCKDNVEINPKYGVRIWTGFVWLRIRTGGGLL